MTAPSPIDDVVADDGRPDDARAVADRDVAAEAHVALDLHAVAELRTSAGTPVARAPRSCTRPASTSSVARRYSDGVPMSRQYAPPSCMP